ncbi:MAG: family metallopeptidase [Flavisolibacter sp.]|nr:family metallopeptidase [Flavisolibacter sp.]
MQRIARPPAGYAKTIRLHRVITILHILSIAATLPIQNFIAYFGAVKKLFLFILTNCLLLIASSQTYWQQKTDYTIDVSLNEKEKTLDGFERLIYTNNSPDTLTYIWFHLWPNAYKNDRTAFSDQLLENGNTRFYFSDKEQRGYINRLEFKVNGVTAKTEDHPQHIDIIKLILPKALPPKISVTIATPFHVKLPFNFSRGGYDAGSFQIIQWYPKPAVYDSRGWHPMPYLEQGEFYSEFGSFDVRITVPKNFVVAATGVLQNDEEKEWLKTRATYSLPEQVKILPGANNRTKKTTASTNSTITTATKTIQFKQSNVHDFAWFANKDFIATTDTCQMPSGKIISVSSYYTPQQKELWQPSIQYAKDALRFYSTEVGEYPYAVATVVQGPQSFGGGMEYPTITIISPVGSAKDLDVTIAHELGHNWFYGILATNEREHPWMDEGMNSFYEGKYIEVKYGRQPKEAELTFQAKATNKTDQPIETSSENFSAVNYGLAAYHKTAEWMKLIEAKIGKEAFRQMMQQYFAEWGFKHPQPEDFKKIAAGKLGADTESTFSLLHTKGILPNNNLKGTSIVSLFKKGAIKSYTISPTKNALLLSPAIGANSYDKLMLGALFTNYGSPVAKASFLAIPLYATGSKSFTGLAKLNYAIRSNGAIRKTDLFFNAASFTMDEFKDEEANKHQMRFVKLVPGIRFTFREKDARSTISKFIQWKTFLINEESLSITTDSIFTPTDTTIKYNYNTPSESRYLNQLQFGYKNSRSLYPFDITMQIEQAQDFVRTALTANYFFNYAKGGGMAVRFFAGKFSYLNGYTIQKGFANDRYHLNMTGPKGYEDYTYSNYFIGRNKFEGLPNQQIMIRDGGFKVRTDLLSSKIGKTDDWLVAANFTTSIPDKINPLSVLPIKIPLRVFADIGTYAEAWDKEADTDHFLFDAGLQIPLLDEAINIYIPIFYSKVYSTYFKSTIPDNRFLKTISFSINLFPNSLKKLNREFEF